MFIFTHSNPAKELSTKNDDKINLFYQFFVNTNTARHAEILFCLKHNVENPLVDIIYLLNERIYTLAELGNIKMDKIVQVDIGKRLTYEHIFHYINENKIVGYNILMNSDILFDSSSLEKLKYTDMHLEKKCMALLRWEYNSIDPSLSKLFGPRFDSQDVWIFHSNFSVTPNQEKAFRFNFGKPGCDNKMIYILMVLGYEIVNDPLYVKTLHYHSSQSRNYSTADRLLPPYGLSVPARFPDNMIIDSLGLSWSKFNRITKNMTQTAFDNNANLFRYIERKLASGEKFIVPRIAGVENNYAFYGTAFKRGQISRSQLQEYFDKTGHIMKNNAGVTIRNLSELVEYSEKYLEAFTNCEIYAGWEPDGHYIKWIQQSHDFMVNEFKNREIIWAFNFDIFHYIYSTPWTWALRGKRVLVISAFEESIKEKIPIRKDLYDGVDLFPECQILTIKPMQTQGSEPSLGYFMDDLRPFLARLDEIKDTYDIALVSCGGYGNIVCNHIYQSGKSAIYVGGVLQMYFGILGARWFRERADILRIFMNKNWSRCKESERPKNYQNVEQSCYW